MGALALCAVLHACADQGPPPDILFVSVDTLRADRIHAWGYARETSPRIDALVASGVQFTQAIAHKGSTWPSITSVMTGKYPITHGVRKNGDMLDPSQVTLPELLKERGYRTAVFLTNMLEAPHRGFDLRVDTVDLTCEQWVWDERCAAEASHWLESLQGEQPFFAWVHFTDPHKPYHPPPPYDRAFGAEYSGPIQGGDELDAITLGQLEPSAADLAHVQDLYDGQSVSTDRYVGEVLAALERSGRAENTLVVFFTDHGEELYDHQRYFLHSCSLYDGVVRIALAFRWPKHLPAGMVVREQVQELDVLPTLFELCDWPLPPSIEGESLAGLMDGSGVRQNPYAYLEYAEYPEQGCVLAIREAGWKYVYNPSGYQPRNPPYRRKSPHGFVYEKAELYDLAADPLEQENVAARHPEVVQRLEVQLLGWYAEKLKTAGRAGAMDEATRASMKRLGYISADEDEDEGKK